MVPDATVGTGWPGVCGQSGAEFAIEKFSNVNSTMSPVAGCADARTAADAASNSNSNATEYSFRNIDNTMC